LVGCEPHSVCDQLHVCICHTLSLRSFRTRHPSLKNFLSNAFSRSDSGSRALHCDHRTPISVWAITLVLLFCSSTKRRALLHKPHEGVPTSSNASSHLATNAGAGPGT
jgi:hypothetical protein